MARVAPCVDSQGPRHAAGNAGAGATGFAPRGVLFDLDGTFLDANQSIHETMNRVLAERGQPTFKRAELQALIGHPLRHILATKARDASLVEPMALRYREVYNESGWVTCEPYAGLPDLAEALRQEGWRVGVVTSKGELEASTVLFDLGILNLFDAVVGDDDQRPLKPDPAPILEACRRLGTSPATTAMVGDTHFDVEAGRNAGCLSLGVLWGNGTRKSLEDAGAHAVARTPEELASLLRRWAALPNAR